jgi:hypothetical protein
MNRRTFLSAAIAMLAWCGARLRPRSPAATTPSWRFSDVPVSWELSWSGRIVRQARALPGQKQACCACVGVNAAAFAEPHGCPYSSEDNMGRTPIQGSPERAYLEYMAREHPHPEFQHSEYHVLRRLKSGELAVDEVYIRLATADEIDVPGGAYAGGRGEAFAQFISVLA